MARKASIDLIMWLILFVFSAFLFACTPKTPINEESSTYKNDVPELATHVGVFVLQKSSFDQEIISQGLIQAQSKSDITFPIAGVIDKIFIKTGQRIKKGELLTQLADYEYRNKCDLIRLEIEQAKLQIEAQLVALGYSKTDTMNVPLKLLNNINLEYSLPILEIKLKEAEHNLAQTQIRSPISGTIANVEGQEGNLTSNYSKLCTVIGMNEMLVKFPILEVEYSLVKPGNTIEIYPFYSPKKISRAIITAINPEVDKNGIIWAYAKVVNKSNYLLEGMKVNIHIRKTIKNQLVVPKSSIVDRQNRTVIFTYRQGKAQWVYTQIDQENANQYVIDESSLNMGDTVIFQNNFDLAHLEDVIIDSLFVL